MEEEDEEIMSIQTIAKETAPFLWTRKLTMRLLTEFKRHCPKVGQSLKSLNLLHNIIARTLKNEFNCEISGRQVCNKLKSIKRKYTQCKEQGKEVVEFGPVLEEVMKMMETSNYNKTVRTRKIDLNESTKGSSSQAAYSVEIIDEGMPNESEILDISQFLHKREAESSNGVMPANCLDPLEGDLVDFGEKARKTDENKLTLLEKKIETQEKSLEERLKKNELIEERNRLIKTLLTKKTKNDVIDAIRKDRLVHHREMKDLWIERLEVERKKLAEKKRKNDLLEERNQLMKALLEKVNKKSDDRSKNGDGVAPMEQTIELE